MLRRFSFRTAPAALALVAVPFVAPVARAQQPDAEIPRPSRTYALTNARVVVAPGRVLERATVVVRDGLIADVGPNVRVPFDAQRIAADSMTVYAGFIDALGQVGFARPEVAQNLPRVPDPANPPRDRAGLQPERRASDMLKADDASIDAHRKAGFGAVHTVPYGGFLPGQGALVLLGGDTPEALVLRDQTSAFATFQTARGVYPGTPMGIMAQWRTLARETTRRAGQRDAYARQSAGRERPAHDVVTDAMRPVASGERPVFFHVRTTLEAYRALRLKDDLGLTLVLAGLPDAADMTDALRTARVPVLLTLDLPKEPARADSTRRDSLGPVGGFSPAFQIGTLANVAGERSNLEARVRATATAYTEAAARLDRAGVPFAFTTIGMKASDVQRNVRRMIGAGLSEDAALAALTTRAADVIGASAQLGTVERGKIANLVVTRGSYFAPAGAVRLVFVDGVPYRYEAPSAPAAGRGRTGASGTAAGAAATPDAGVAAVGTWGYEVETPQGTLGGTLTVRRDGSGYAGSISSEMGTMALSDVSVSGNVLSFSFTAPQFGALAAAVTIDGDTFAGTITVPNVGAIPMTGTRRPN